MAAVLEGIDDVEWGRLRHAYGTAEDVPDQLRELRSSDPDRRRAALHSLYLARFPGVPVHVMTSDESEAVKGFQNGFFAVKVSYWNECRTLADKLGLNWDTVMEGILADGRIAHAHTKVPGPDGKFGFGPDSPNGCLQKDSASLVHQLESSGLLASVTRGAVERNREDRKKVS